MHSVYIEEDICEDINIDVDVDTYKIKRAVYMQLFKIV